ncbi:MAG: endonuclease III [Cytophagales bacterium]
MTKRERYKAFITYFSKHMPAPTTELVYRTPFELLVAVILSAQCRDKRVNKVTPALFKAFPTPELMAVANYEDLLEHIRTISYPRSKANYLIKTAQVLVHRFGGQVPNNMVDLQQLYGVGRKSASVILAVIYEQPAMPVDTHVMRIAHRMGLVSPINKTPLAIEREIRLYVPSQELIRFHHWAVLHGRYTCTAMRPQCTGCPLQAACDFFQQGLVR